MNSIIRELLDIRSAIETLTSFAPGNGYDPIGNALSNLAIRPLNIDYAEQALLEAEEISPGLTKVIQNASIQSEIELELSHASNLFSENQNDSSLDDRLFQDYQYDWFTGRSALEASFLPQNTEDSNLIYYFGTSGIPFSALSLQKRIPSKAVWFDANDNTRDFAVKILKSLDIETIEMAGLDFKIVQEKLKSHRPSYTTMLDSSLISRDLLSILQKGNIDNISFVTTHGLNKLLYPPVDEEMVGEFFTFKKGYYPERIGGMTKPDWHQSSGLSFVSLALYSAKN